MKEPLQAAMRICQSFMDAKDALGGKGKPLHERAIDPRKLLTDAFVVSKAYMELCLATGHEAWGPKEK